MAETKTVCGLAAPSSTMDRVAPRFCAATGRNATWTWHEADGARVAPEHRSAVFTKSLAPEKLAMTMCRLEVPVLVIVTGADAVVVPRLAVPRSTVLGVTDTVGGGGGGGACSSTETSAV